MRKSFRWIGAVVAFVSIVGASVVVTLVLIKRMRTGTWAVPDSDDMAALKSDVVRAKERVTEKVLGRKPEPSKTIFLNRDGAELIAGSDDAAAGISSVVLSGTESKVRVPKWSGTKRNWGKLMACVRDQFKPFDVQITDVRPDSKDFLMAVVGGRVQDIGVQSNHVGGLAPFSGEPVPRAVVFAFSKKLRNRVQPICETLAMEIAHAYGLDHAYHCPDVMTYLRGCGKKRFRNKTVRCGEHKKRDCKGGSPTQNSVERLLEVLGPAKPPTPSPAASVAPGSKEPPSKRKHSRPRR